MKSPAAAPLLFALLGAAAHAYPIEAAAYSGIRRLDGYLHKQAATGGSKLPPGALLPLSGVALQLTSAPALDITSVAKDPVLQAAIETMFAKRDPSYTLAVVDITDPTTAIWAGLREDKTQLPGSVGKLGVMIAFFDNLARAFPETAARERILGERIVEGGDWVQTDPHPVPVYNEASGRNVHRKVVRTDKFRLAEWMDHMISASANAAGSLMWKEAMLLRQFGAAYPPTPEAEAEFWAKTPKKDLTAMALAVIEEPLLAAGIDLAGFRQGTMFTGGGQRHVPGVASSASPKQLVRILLRIEEGRMVDAWSSLEMKRYLYITKRRYRYCYAPELDKSAVYFKSGSVYSCRPEAGFSCGQFMGNRMNLMNSVAIVESPATGPDQKRYLVAIMSNVLKVNSAWDHSRIAAAIDVAIRSRKAAVIDDKASASQQSEAGGKDE